MKLRNICNKTLCVLSTGLLLTTAVACGDLPDPDPAADDEVAEPTESAATAQCNFGKTVYNTLIGNVNIGYTGPIYAMSTNPASGGVDVGSHCLTQVNYYRRLKNLAPYTLKPLTTTQKCCLIAEAKAAVDYKRAHFMARCLSGSPSQGAGGGGRGGTGTVRDAVTWVPKLFYQEGASGGHYQAMKRPQTRQFTCSYYAKDRYKHAILLNWY
jgi:hypothetical protein